MEPEVAESVHRLRVARVIDETAEARSIVFEVPDDDREAFRYAPGQYLTLRVPSERTGSVARCYSLASSPHRDRELRVVVKRTAGGFGSNWICDHVGSGSALDVLPPAGIFTPRSLDVPTILLAGGSGITPVVSIATSILTAGSAPVTLVYANRDDRSVIMAGELGELAAAHPDRFRVIHWLESVQGLPDRDCLAALVRPFVVDDVEVFVCGPGPFMTAAKQAATDAGVPRASIHLEVFTSLTANPFEVETAAPEGPGAPEKDAGDAADGGGADVEVEFEGASHLLRWPVGVPLLDVLLEQGFDVPYMCQSGECGTCQAVCESGSVRMLNNDLLDAEDVADGYVLTCQLVVDDSTPARIVF